MGDRWSISAYYINDKESSCPMMNENSSLDTVSSIKQETAKGGMTGLQSGNIIGKDPPRTNINVEVNTKYCMTLNRQSQV